MVLKQVYMLRKTMSSQNINIYHPLYGLDSTGLFHLLKFMYNECEHACRHTHIYKVM